MNTKKVEKHLRKINALYESLKLDSELSSIEKDLLKSYVLKLYEAIIDHGEVEAPAVSKPKAVESTSFTIEAEPSTRPTVDQNPVTSNPSTNVESIIRKELHQEETKVQEVKKEPIQPIQLDAKEEKHVVEKTIQKDVPASPTSSVSEELKEVFEPLEITELSDRLSNAPIQDLTRQGFSINEKIFNISELFGGDGAYYQTVLERLNKFSTYEEAKQYLSSGVAKDKNWADPSRIKKAAKFVQVIQRRYLG